GGGAGVSAESEARRPGRAGNDGIHRRHSEAGSRESHVRVIELALAAMAVLLGAWVYCVLSIVAVKRHFGSGAGTAATSRRATPLDGGADSQSAASRLIGPPAISVLKPLSGAEPLLKSNLRSFFDQDYSSFELLFAVRTENDPAVPVVSDLQRQYPHITSHLIVTGEPPYANAKVFSLSKLTV